MKHMVWVREFFGTLLMKVVKQSAVSNDQQTSGMTCANKLTIPAHPWHSGFTYVNVNEPEWDESSETRAQANDP